MYDAKLHLYGCLLVFVFGLLILCWLKADCLLFNASEGYFDGVTEEILRLERKVGFYAEVLGSDVNQIEQFVNITVINSDSDPENCICSIVKYLCMLELFSWLID